MTVKGIHVLRQTNFTDTKIQYSPAEDSPAEDPLKLCDTSVFTILMSTYMLIS